jgi:hypothetical protein
MRQEYPVAKILIAKGQRMDFCITDETAQVGNDE